MCSTETVDKSLLFVEYSGCSCSRYCYFGLLLLDFSGSFQHLLTFCLVNVFSEWLACRVVHRMRAEETGLYLKHSTAVLLHYTALLNAR